LLCEAQMPRHHLAVLERGTKDQLEADSESKRTSRRPWRCLNAMCAASSSAEPGAAVHTEICDAQDYAGMAPTPAQFLHSMVPHHPRDHAVAAGACNAAGRTRILLPCPTASARPLRPGVGVVQRRGATNLPARACDMPCGEAPRWLHSPRLAARVRHSPSILVYNEAVRLSGTKGAAACSAP
jgi:hypothetical protein